MGSLSDSIPQLSSLYHEPVRIAIIGGTGLQSLPSLTHITTLTDIRTPWGAPSSPITILQHNPPSSSSSTQKPTPIAFLARHGPHHEHAPHEIPSRANIAALRSLGIRTIIAFSAVGSLREEIAPRDFVVPDQIIDRTKGVRPFTFFEGGYVAHAGFADPFDVALSRVVSDVGAQRTSGSKVKVHERGTLVCMEGPQFSTRAESNLYRSWGCDVVNMSALPEAKLAREAEIAYVMTCMATDYDCWRSAKPASTGLSTGEEEGDVSVQGVMGHMKANAENASVFLSSVLDELSKEEHAALVRGEHLKGQMSMAAGITGEAGRSKDAKERIEWLFPEGL
ncbi:MAG: S-methyl-5-thioadenosine phosphorylase [Chrysothrix sp. TS-e1954]|nr:MAG: S-methyl-5-thioadenosine phosphorylase [Chrysothrix sp. TS-e1954]